MKFVNLYASPSFLAVPLAVLLTIAAPRARAASDAPIGMAASVSGDVATVQSGQKAPLRLLGRVKSGTQLVTGRGARAVIILFGTGQRFLVGGEQKALISAGGVTGAKLLPAMSGPSQGVVKMLGQARVGAVMGRASASFQRLVPASPGYFVGAPGGYVTGAPPRFEWLALDGATTYNWTLFDGADNVIYSVTTTERAINYPATAPPLLARRPYLWKLSGFGGAGKPVSASRWGIVTMLSAADLSAMENAANALAPDPALAPAPGAEAVIESLLLQSEVYRSYGALNRALEIFQDVRLAEVEGIADARKATLDLLSPFARMLAQSALGVKP